MRALLLLLATAFATSLTLRAQQPEIVHARLTTETAAHGLQAELAAIERSGAPTWVGYRIPTDGHFSSGGSDARVAYLEGDHPTAYRNSEPNAPQDHAILLLRLDREVGKLRVESPDRTLDAGGLRFVWLPDVDPADSIATLQTIVLSPDNNSLRDAAVFAIALHQAPTAIPTLVRFTDAGNAPEIREKAAFWLSSRNSPEGFAAIQRLAREDPDARFREKLTFDLTLTKQPAALEELIRMAHTDPSPQVRKQAQFWMATVGGARVTADLRTLATTDGNSDVRKSAVFALSRLPGDQAATQLIEVAQTSNDPEVRKQAVFWLGQSDDPKALAYLSRLLRQ